MSYYILEPSNYEDFYPLALNRLVNNLVCGAFSTKERLSQIFKEGFQDLSSRSKMLEIQEEKIITGYIFCGNYLFKDEIQNFIDQNTVVIDENNQPIVFYVEGVSQNDLYDSQFIEEVKKGKKIQQGQFLYQKKLNNIADYIIHQENQLHFDLENHEVFEKKKASSKNLSVEGNREDLFIKDDKNISSYAVFNTSKGRIVIEENVSVGAFSYIEGPCILKRGSVIDQAKIREGCFIGESCRVGGEVATSIFLAFSNKHHEGFVGHSYVGCFVNFGALSTTSDLKNNYHPVTLNYLKNTIPTDTLKLGSFIGDYTKIAIGTLLNTGSMIGLGCVLFPLQAGLFPKNIPSFSWGDGTQYTKYRWETFLSDSETILARRKQVLSESMKKILYKIYHGNEQ